MRLTDQEKLDALRLELTKYAELENSELGELCMALISLSYSSLISENFRADLKKELKWHLQNFKENSEIVEENQVVTTKVKKLVWS